MMNSLQVRSHMEETMVLLTSSQPESLKKGPEVKDKDQEQRCSDYTGKTPTLKPAGLADPLSCEISGESCTPRAFAQLQKVKGNL